MKILLENKQKNDLKCPPPPPPSPVINSNFQDFKIIINFLSKRIISSKTYNNIIYKPPPPPPPSPINK